jgi:CHASE2 domain-containing sensor protein
LALVVNPDVFLVMALLIGLLVTGGIFFAFTSGWWPFIFTTLTGAIFLGAVVVLLRRQSQRQRRLRR